MAYIGKPPIQGAYQKVDPLTFNGVTATFSLLSNGVAVFPGNTQNVLVSLNGVLQEPITDYTISGSQITFLPAPVSGSTFFAVVLGNTYDLGTIADNTVNTAQLVNSAVTTAKIADSAVTAAKLGSFTSAELLPKVTDETGTGVLVFNGSPTFTTSLATTSTTFSLFNATATTVNAFGGANVISIGASTGTFSVNNQTLSFANATSLSASALTSITLGSGTAASTTNIQTGAISTGIKQINIGTGSAAGSTTSVVLGSTAGTSTVNIQGSFQVNGVAFSGGATVLDDTTTNATYYPTLSNATSGTFTTARVSSTKLNFNPSTGQLQATSFNSLSDGNKKTNVVKARIGVTSMLEGVEFDFTDGSGHSSGVIAQQIAPILPHLVYTDAEGNKSVNYSGLVAYLIEDIKDLSARLEKLEA